MAGIWNRLTGSLSINGDQIARVTFNTLVICGSFYANRREQRLQVITCLSIGVMLAILERRGEKIEFVQIVTFDPWALKASENPKYYALAPMAILANFLYVKYFKQSQDKLLMLKILMAVASGVIAARLARGDLGPTIDRYGQNNDI